MASLAVSRSGRGLGQTADFVNVSFLVRVVLGLLLTFAATALVTHQHEYSVAAGLVLLTLSLIIDVRRQWRAEWLYFGGLAVNLAVTLVAVALFQGHGRPTAGVWIPLTQWNVVGLTAFALFCQPLVGREGRGGVLRRFIGAAECRSGSAVGSDGSRRGIEVKASLPMGGF